jgi:hypothetical protein
MLRYLHARLVPAAFVAAGLAILAARVPPTQAGDHHREHPIPAVTSGYLVTVRPGEQIRVAVTFEAANENCLQIYNQRTGHLRQVWNNYDGGGGTWTSPKAGDEPLVLLFVGRHKDSPPDGRKPWRLSKFGVLDKTEGSVIVGWEDGVDDDYNDAAVDIRWVR